MTENLSQNKEDFKKPLIHALNTEENLNYGSSIN